MAKNKKKPLTSFLSGIRKNLFGDSDVPEKKHSEPKAAAKTKTDRPKAVEADSKRPAYVIQIGFDFGTSFSKCIIRDVGFNRAQIFMPQKPANADLPFLMPTTLRLHGTKLSRAPLNGKYYGRGYLPFIKMALASNAQGRASASCLKPYRDACNEKQWTLSEFIMAAAVFFLAKSFEEIDAFIKNAYPDFGKNEDDQQFVNVSIPIFKERNSNIERAFNSAIKVAWEIHPMLANLNSIQVDELIELIRKHDKAKDKTVEDGAPYLYPEISAGLQVYAQSNSFPQNIYLFSDAGAGTVDQAVFTYHKNGFSFLGALVSPLGSSQIEAIAAQHSNLSLEELRMLKEAGDFRENALRQARDLVGRNLEKKTGTLVADARDYKLYLKDQILKTSLLFSGGGHCQDPYELAVRNVFNGPMFRKKVNIRTMGLPDIHDLEFPWNAEKKTWVNRLHVAYGLSFPDYMLEKVKLPDEISDANQGPVAGALY